MKHLEKVLRRIHQEKLMINQKKCITMDPDKVKSTLEWPTPKCIGDVRSFHWLTSYHRKFVRGLTSLTP